MKTSDEEVYGSPSGWVADHIRRYVETDGKDGHEWKPGVPTLLLTTRGRKTGKLRRTALIHRRDGDHYLVVASKGGAKDNPSWYLNLTKNPEVQLQVGRQVSARARTATAEEKPKLWQIMTSIWPDYDQYQAKCERDIPVVLLERLSCQ
jgi:deazaflavin-dependent oxidoreductase (nitroreductase family)